MIPARVRDVLRETSLQFPGALDEACLTDVARTAFHVGLVRRGTGRHPAVCELGGGGGLFAPVCASLGMKVTQVDHLPALPESLRLYRHLGVTLHPADILHGEIEFAPNAFDAVVCWHAIRHIHTAPEGFFQRIRTWLRPGGAFILGVPNGATRRSREPRVADLYNLAKQMELRRVRVVGRNWVGFQRPPLLRAVAGLLRLHPPFCSDLYLIGHR